MRLGYRNFAALHAGSSWRFWMKSPRRKLPNWNAIESPVIISHSILSNFHHGFLNVLSTRWSTDSRFTCPRRLGWSKQSGLSRLRSPKRITHPVIQWTATRPTVTLVMEARERRYLMPVRGAFQVQLLPNFIAFHWKLELILPRWSLYDSERGAPSAFHHGCCDCAASSLLFF